MKCPICDEAMREIDRQGVNIDICPGCKGIWLDRGELEKLIDLAVSRESSAAAIPPIPGVTAAPPESMPVPTPIPIRYETDYRDHHDRHEKHHGHHDKHDRHYNEHQREYYDQYGHRRKRGWLSNLSDIFD